MDGRGILAGSQEPLQEWNPLQPRILSGKGGGRWTKWLGHQESTVKSLKPGERLEVPGGASVTRQSGTKPRYLVQGKTGSVPQVHTDAVAAARDAARRSAESSHPDSPGGAKGTSLQRVLKAEGVDVVRPTTSVTGPADMRKGRRLSTLRTNRFDSTEHTPDYWRSQRRWTGRRDNPEAPRKGGRAKAIFGDFEHTMEMYSRKGPMRNGKRTIIWDPERKKMHDRWIEDMLKGHKRQKNPVALFTAGGPGSGKSSFLDQPGGQPDDAVTINPDEFKLLLPEYIQMRAADDDYAGHGAHEESSYLAKRLLAEAQARGFNVVIDGVGDSEPNKFRDKMIDAEAKGYKVEVAMSFLPLDKGQGRVKARAENPDSKDFGRKIAPGIVEANYIGASARLKDYEDLDWIDLKIYDTDVAKGSPPILIGTSAKDKKGITAIGQHGERKMRELRALGASKPKLKPKQRKTAGRKDTKARGRLGSRSWQSPVT